jgi:hypothetical protein
MYLSTKECDWLKIFQEGVSGEFFDDTLDYFILIATITGNSQLSIARIECLSLIVEFLESLVVCFGDATGIEVMDPSLDLDAGNLKKDDG